jgi:hypothetical protein
MKVCFPPDTSEYGRQSGAAKKWERFVANLRMEDDVHTITDNPKLADIVIHGAKEQFGSYSVRSQLRPLTDDDIHTVVWDCVDRPVGRLSGFYCALDKWIFDPTRHRSMHYPVVFNEFVEEFPQDDAKYNFGFVGGMTAGLRRRLYSKLKPTESRDNSIIKIQGIDFATVFDGNFSPLKRDYLEFLRRTKFILCPRGFGIGTLRLFESMQAGRVPIIISDAYTMPSHINWSECSIRVRENDISRIPAIVEAHLPDWPRVAKTARTVWHNNFSNEHTFKYLMANLDEILVSLPEANVGLRLRYALGVSKELAGERLRPVLGPIRALVRL